MFRNLLYILLLAALTVSGCAYAEVRPIRSSDVEGIRFYRPWPYLWVVKAEKGGCSLTVNYLPDTSQEYIIIPHTGVGTLKVAPTLAEGWNLTAFEVTADSKTAELVSAITGIAGNIVAGAMPPAMQRTGFGPGLYRFEFDSNGRVATLTEVFHLTDENGQPSKCSTAPRQQG